MSPLKYLILLCIAALAAFVVYPSSASPETQLFHELVDAIEHRRPLGHPLDLFPLFDGPVPWPLTVTRIIGMLAERGLVAREVERTDLPDNVPNLRGPAAYFYISSATPYYVVLTTGQPQLSFYD